MIKWVLGIVGSVLTAVLIACGSWIFHANAEMQSVKTTVQMHHESFIDHQNANSSDFRDIKKELTKLDSKIDKLIDLHMTGGNR
jgi:hypothetical protein